jgi:hypothetical protein
MKNKLLLSSALVGGLIASGSSFAQTSVTGNIALSYKAQSQKLAASAATTKSERFFGRETQINIANKGKLNNGLDYAMGFSLEFDGDTTTAARDASISNENIYIDFISGNTTFTVGLDHIQNVTQTVLPVIYNHYDILAGMGASATNAVGANSKESIGAGIIQKVPGAGLTLSALWVPQTGFTGTGNDNVGKADAVATATSTVDRNSSYEVGVRGADAFGVKGLAVSAFYNNEKGSTPGTLATNNDVNGWHAGASYGIGNVRIGGELNANTANTGHTNNVQTVSATYSVSPNATLGVWRAKHNLGNNTTGALVDEKAIGFGVGYNFGPLAVMVDHTRLDNQDGVRGTDVTETSLKFLAAF